nr:tripartite tricarboxylate transporter substrate binding protein [Syntrophorhabdaceae bacterium]
LMNRVVGKYIEKYLKVTVVPDNKPGGGGVIVSSNIARAKPDGYTVGNLGDFVIMGALLGQAPYKLEDINVFAEVARSGRVLVVPEDSPYKTMQDFVKAAKAKPGMKYGHPGVATIISMGMASLNKYAGLKMIPVPFKGDMEVISSVLGKHVPVGVTSAFAAAPQAEAKKLRILFSFEEAKSVGLDPSIPDLVKVFGKDVPDLPVSIILAVPAKTPKEIVEILEKTTKKVTSDPGFVAELKKNHIAARFTDRDTMMKKEIPRKIPILKEILKEAGMIKN